MTKKDDLLPIMPVMVRDFLSSESAAVMTNAQFGAYWRLLLCAWLSGCSLPDDDRQLASIARMSPREWRRDGAVVKERFPAYGDTGRLRNHKQWEVYQRALVESKQSKTRARAAAEARWENARRNAQALQEQSYENAQALPEQCPQNAITNHKSQNPDPKAYMDTVSTADPPAVNGHRACADERAVGLFIEWWGQAYRQHQGAHYVGRPSLDFQEADRLLGVYNPDELRELATVFLTIPDDAVPWMRGKTRTLAMFRSRVSACEKELNQQRTMAVDRLNQQRGGAA